MKKSTILSILGFAAVIAIVSLTFGPTLLQGRTPDLASFIGVHFAGYLFFLLMPVEVLVPWYIAQGHNIMLIFLLAISTAIIAHTINYLIGRNVPEKKLIEYIGKKKYTKSKKFIHKYGAPIIFVFDVFPLSSPILILVCGMTRFPLKKALYYSFLGLTAKYLFIISFFLI